MVEERLKPAQEQGRNNCHTPGRYSWCEHATAPRRSPHPHVAPQGPRHRRPGNPEPGRWGTSGRQLGRLAARRPHPSGRSCRGGVGRVAHSRKLRPPTSSHKPAEPIAQVHPCERRVDPCCHPYRQGYDPASLGDRLSWLVGGRSFLEYHRRADATGTTDGAGVDRQSPQLAARRAGAPGFGVTRAAVARTLRGDVGVGGSTRRSCVLTADRSGGGVTVIPPLFLGWFWALLNHRI